MPFPYLVPIEIHSISKPQGSLSGLRIKAVSYTLQYAGHFTLSNKTYKAYRKIEHNDHINVIYSEDVYLTQDVGAMLRDNLSSLLYLPNTPHTRDKIEYSCYQILGEQVAANNCWVHTDLGLHPTREVRDRCDHVITKDPLFKLYTQPGLNLFEDVWCFDLNNSPQESTMQRHLPNADWGDQHFKFGFDYD